MAYIMSQIKDIVNDAVEDALGKSGSTIQTLDTSDFVSLGAQLANMNLLEGWFSALANRIVQTIYFIRVYEGNTRSVLRDESAFGAFKQKVYYDLPDAVDNPTWNIPDGNGDYTQVSPYDVNTTISVSAMIFGGEGTWSIEFVRPLRQIKGAFLSEAAMMGFIDGMFVAAENSFKFEEERIVATAVNTAMANSIVGGKARNLLAEYNVLHPDDTLTAIECRESADFFKYMSKEIARTIENMGKMSTVYNVLGYTTHTPKDKIVVEMLSEMGYAADYYLQADTFHDELTKLPKYESVPFWQNSGSNFAFDDCSKISIIHNDFKTELNPTGKIELGGIICFVHDEENVAAYFGDRYSWDHVNVRQRVATHGEQAEKGFAVDGHANAMVFYIADSE